MPVVPVDNDIAEIDRHAHLDPLARRGVVDAGCHGLLQQRGTFDRVDYARELGQQAVAHEFENATVVLRNPRLEQSLEASPHAAKSAALVSLHQSAVADDVDGKDGGKAAFHRSPLGPKV